MKIAIISSGLEGKGGTETVITNLINNDISNIYSLFISDIKNNNKWLNKVNVTNENLNYNNGSSKIIKAYNLFHFVIKKNPQIILCLSTRYLLFLKTIRNLFHLNFKIVFWPHFSLVNEKDISINKLKFADYYFSISTGISNQLKSFDIDSKKIFTIFNPVFKSNKTVKLPNNETKFIMFSRVQYEKQKNLKEVIKACSLLNGNWKLYIYGDDSINSYNELEKCKKLAKDLSVLDNIYFMGWHSNPWDKVQKANCLVLSSNYEGFPLALCESISHGIPVISSDCPTGPNDIVKNNKNGFLYEMGDFEMLAKRMQLFIDNKNIFDHNDVKATISEFYVENYINNVDLIYKQIRS